MLSNMKNIKNTYENSTIEEVREKNKLLTQKQKENRLKKRRAYLLKNKDTLTEKRKEWLRNKRKKDKWISKRRLFMLIEEFKTKNPKNNIIINELKKYLKTN